jgi:hypothetical protein
MKVRSFGMIVLGLFSIVGLAVGSRPGSAAGQKIVTRTEDGVPVVYNPKKPAPPAGVPSSLVLKHDFTIGRESGDENYMFSELRSVQVDDQENIYALDMKEIKVRVYDKSGKHLRTFGKKGKGPGEIDTPLRMEMTPGKNLVIEDFASAKFVFFSLDGACVKEIPLGKYQFLIRFKFNSHGNIYADARTFDETKSVSELIKFSPDFKPLATVASFEEKRAPRVMSPFSSAFSLQVTAEDNLIWTIGQTDKYEFTVMNADGKTIRRIVKDYDPVKVTGAVKDRLLQDYGEGDIPPGYTVQVPSHLPALYYFIIDDHDRLIVRTYEFEEKADGPWLYYDVFDADGRYITRFCLPEREMAFISKKNKLYCMVQESEEGIPQVKRYDMTWK